MTPYGPVRRCTAGIESIKFQPAQTYQRQNEWCWAACISMVFAYYGHAVSQERIVKEVWGRVVDMPGQPEQILSDLNRTWNDDAGKAFKSRADALSANASTAVKDLENNQPLIIGALGHAMVLTALTGDTNVQTGAWQIVEAVVRDPWPGRGGRRVLSPVEWFHVGFAARVRVE
jgi:ABC-type bacteriocin/lantibiotic exporter with double-glycine peptidase domain